ncbi:Cadherin EGF LAG seven-pass G-type receptor 1 [Stylophora pistillata]|uniref:Cadherin EGF LAG seven-pass G-type receptor 1 n=1 Tax=Stylophora pistillata TaxID=50429 RepID=A0A2B4RIV8_STYPI|nr:Cadherin EGF LAG seven-pass G-type receptor 1 [Stylophora pistillata]
MIRKSIFNAAIALEEFALNYGKNNLTDGNSSVKIDSHKLVLVIQKADRENAGEFYPRNQELQATMKLSCASFVNNGIIVNKVSVVVGIFYKDLHEILFIDQSFTIQTGNTRYLDSGIMAMAMDPKPEKLQENVILNFRNLNVHEGERICMFWSGLNESSGGFSETGCYEVASESNSEETVCSCDHLTHFAVLVDYNGSPGLTEGDETILEIITYVGLGLSILGILLTILLYAFLTDIWQPLSQIRLSLSVALGAGQIIFLAGRNATENKASCITAAAFLQYFLMAAFCWMFVEGIYFYLFIVKVYNINTKMHMYHIISWAKHFDNLPSYEGDEHINPTNGERKPYAAYTGILIFVLHCVRNSQIRESLNRKMSVICSPAADHGNSVKKGSRVNPDAVSNMWVVKMHSFKE